MASFNQLTADTDEEWRPIPGWESFYEVSNFGRVRSLERYINHPYPGVQKLVRNRILRQRTDKRGYKRVGLSDLPRRRQHRKVHSLVLIAFLGPCPDGMMCCHNDGNPSNNHINNLRWGTQLSNQEDRKRHGTYMVGDRHQNTIVSDADVSLIRRIYRPKCRLLGAIPLAKFLGVSRQTVSEVASGYRRKQSNVDILEGRLMGYNRVILQGNCTRDMETRFAHSGIQICNFGIAVNRRSGSGESAKDEVLFIEITAFGRLAEVCSEYLSKGSPALVEGHLKFEQWEKDGQKRSRHVVIAENVQFLGRRGDDTAPTRGTTDLGEDDVPF